jgi:hypothetical protein
LKAEQPLSDAGTAAGPAGTNRELDMPIDLRAMFSVQLLAKADLPAELAEPKARLEAGVWRLDHVEIDGKPYALVFRSQHPAPSP